MSEPMVRLAFVGVGNMGQAAHLKNYALLPGCAVVALAELDEPRGRAVATRYGISRVYRHHAELLAEGGFDALVCSQPFERHGALLPELLAAGKPLFSEKPVGRSRAAAEAVVAAGARSGAVHMVGYHKRCDPATVAARRQIEAWQASGEVGALKYVRACMPPGDWLAAGFTGIVPAGPKPAGLAPFDAPEYDEPALAKAFDAFVNYYIHQVNLLRWLAGEAYSVSYADPSGTLLVAHTASGRPLLLEMATHRTTLDWQESATVFFERGWVRVDFPAPLASFRPGRLTVFRDVPGTPPTTTEVQLPWEHAMLAQARAFVKVVRGEAPPPCAASEAVEDLRVARQYLDLLHRR